jgi:hypothetical protein
MKHHWFLRSYAVLLLASLAVNPGLQAAKPKGRPTPKEHTARTAPASQQEVFQKHVEQEIASLRDDVYTRATWKRLQEVKQTADDTAGSMKLVTLSAAGIGFVLGCVVTFVITRRMGRSDESLKIT